MTNKRIVLVMWLVVVLLAGVTAALVLTLGWPGGETTTVEIDKQTEPKPTAGTHVTTTMLGAENGSAARAVIFRDRTCSQSLTLEPVEPGTIRSGCAAIQLRPDGTCISFGLNEPARVVPCPASLEPRP